MYKIAYDASRESLLHPGDAVNFFQYGAALDTDQALCAEMARVAYVKELDRLANYLDRGGFELVWAIGYDTLGTQLFIAKTKADLGNQRLVVAFRGTEPDDPSDIITDANLLEHSWFDSSHRLLGHVHGGFADALLADAAHGNILAQLLERLSNLAGSVSGILLTGHSLGAALATLTASCLTDAALAGKTRLSTFGSPRVGDAEFVGNMPNIPHDRFVDCSDLVTRVPPTELGFRHTGTLRYVNQDGRVVAGITDDDAPEVIEDRFKAAAAYLLKYSYLPGTAWVRELADHAPINYLSAVAGLRV